LIAALCTLKVAWPPTRCVSRRLTPFIDNKKPTNCTVISTIRILQTTPLFRHGTIHPLQQQGSHTPDRNFDPSW
jgi:hypothetical protein